MQLDAPTHHNVESAEELDSLVDCSLHVRLLAHICLDCGGLDVGIALLDEREGLLGCCEVDIDEKNVGALLREEERGLEADSPTRRESWSARTQPPRV